MKQSKRWLWLGVGLIIVLGAGVIWVSLKAKNRQDKRPIQLAKRPVITIDGVSYTDPYMPHSALPYGYKETGKLGADQVNDSHLEGLRYFTNPNENDLFVYQKSGKRVSFDTRSGDKKDQVWQYTRWIPSSDENKAEKVLSLDDLRFLLARDEKISFEDLASYQSRDVGSGVHIEMYRIDAIFHFFCSRFDQSFKTCWLSAFAKPDEASKDDEQLDFFTTSPKELEAFVERHKQRVGGYE